MSLAAGFVAAGLAAAAVDRLAIANTVAMLDVGLEIELMLE